MASTSIRISSDVRDKIKAAADKQQKSINDMVDEMVELWEREEFRAAMRKSFEALREDPVAWKEYMDEMAAWDVTLMDGLEDEPPFIIDDETSS